MFEQNHMLGTAIKTTLPHFSLYLHLTEINYGYNDD